MRINPIAQFSIALVVVAGALSAVLGLFLKEQGQRVLIEAHVTLYPQLVQHVGGMHPRLLDIFTDDGGTPAREAELFLEDLRELTGADRVKMWSSDSVVLWSDADEGTGEQFEDNELLQEALAGRVAYEVEEPTERENVTESDLGRALEVYVPVRIEGRVRGAIETYNEADALFEQIRRNARTTWLAVAAATVLLYGLLFAIYYRSHMAERRSRLQLTRAHDATIYALAHQAEQRDEITGKHLERTSIYIITLALELRKHHAYSDHLTRGYLRDLFRAAPMHDIGKVRIRDDILRKPGKLSDEEFREMQLHAEYGAETLQRVQERLGFQSFLTLAVQLTRHHHERWDGTGYPDGLAGDEIPLSARLMAVADVYDALRSERPYKSAFSHERSVEIIEGESGTQFDPTVVRAFMRVEREFARISGEADHQLDAAFAKTQSQFYPKPIPRRG